MENQKSVENTVDIQNDSSYISDVGQQTIECPTETSGTIMTETDTNEPKAQEIDMSESNANTTVETKEVTKPKTKSKAKSAPKPKVDVIVDNFNPDDFEDTVQALKIITDSNRIVLLKTLQSNGVLMVGELCSKLETSQPNLSATLAKLRASKIVNAKRMGKNVAYQLSKNGENLLKIFDSCHAKFSTKED